MRRSRSARACTRKVNRSAHLVWARNFYSVPFSHIGALVGLRVTETMLDV
ncbi:Mu transposase domain-containing protein [Microterricola gilva]